jgi:hypothetical protein
MVRCLLNHPNYTLDADLLLKKVSGNPRFKYRTLEILCPNKENAPSTKLFNYDDLVRHTEYFRKAYQDRGTDPESDPELRSSKLYIDNDFSQIKKGLESSFGALWGQEINWEDNVMINYPDLSPFSSDVIKENMKRQIKSHIDRGNPLCLIDRHDKISKLQFYVLKIKDRGGEDSEALRLFTIELNLKDRKKSINIRIHKSYEQGTRAYVKDIPLHKNNTSEGLCIYSTTALSNFSSKVSRWYLHAATNKRGNSKIESCKSKINKLSNSTYITDREKNGKIIEQHNEVERIKNERKYQELRIRTKGVLLYAYLENNIEEFNKAISNISKYNKENIDWDDYFDDIAVSSEEKHLDSGNVTRSSTTFTINQLLTKSKYDSNYVDTSKAECINDEIQPELNNFANEIRRLDFPFLYRYNDFKRTLPETFAYEVLNEISKEMIGRLETTSSSDLRFEVTVRFFKKVRDYLWGESLSFEVFRPSRIRDKNLVDDNTFAALVQYYFKVGSYIGHIEGVRSRIEEFKWNEMIKQNEYDLIQRRLISKVEKNINNNSGSPDIISIVDERNSSSNDAYFLDIVNKDIAHICEDKYIITESCLISKKKAAELNSLILSMHHGQPETTIISLDAACNILVKSGGLPKSCLDINKQELLKKLGFIIRKNGTPASFIVATK